MILIIKHIDIEGPETLGDFLKQKREDLQIIDLSRGDNLPNDIENLKAVIVLGGPMNIYEEEKYPFLSDENVFIQRVVESDVPFLGICLGSQLLAKAFGAPVGLSPVKEIGFSNVTLTEAGRQDSLFKGIDGGLEVFQWHEDMFDVPLNAKLLASGKRCPHQAFIIGSSAYGLQFHIEITDHSIAAWCDAYLKHNSLKDQQMGALLAEYDQKKDAFNQMAEVIYENFYEIITSSN